MVMITRLSDYIEEYRITVAAGEVLWRPDHNYENSKHGGQYRVPPRSNYCVPQLPVLTPLNNPSSLLPFILRNRFYPCQATFWTPSIQLLGIFFLIKFIHNIFVHFLKKITLTIESLSMICCLKSITMIFFLKLLFQSK